MTLSQHQIQDWLSVLVLEGLRAALDTVEHHIVTLRIETFCLKLV